MPQPLVSAAQRLWALLISVPVQRHQLTRFSCSVETRPDVWQVLNAAECAQVKGRFYWQDRRQETEMVGLGIADDIRSSVQDSLAEHWSTMQSVTAGSDAVYFGGLSFNGRNGMDHWQGFDALRFALPVIELRRTGQHWQLSVQLYADSTDQWHEQFDTARQILHLLSSPIAAHNTLTMPEVRSRQSLTSEQQWQEQVNNALHHIETHELDKVVLARATAFEFEQPTALAAFAQRWQERTPGTFGFSLNFGEASFVGFSPERLLRQQGRDIATEALAGTQPRGENALEDQAYEHILRSDQKLIHEHRLVVDFIADRLKPFSKHTLSDAQVSILKLANVQHRQAGYRAQLSSAASAPILLRSLFPTPAVCGLPTDQAFDCIASYEPIQRGWYAGTVGIIGNDNSEFSVAIRSGLLQSNRFINYAGAGIVKGSNADAEWQELNDKVKIVEQLLN